MTSAAAEPVGPRPEDELVRLRVDLAYDGTAFAGWAAQPGQRTVAGVVEQALVRLLRVDLPTRLTVAGRTDAGVHARGQVAHVDVPVHPGLPVGAAAVQPLSRLLPADVRVREVAQAPPGFDARFSALSRRYVYRVCDEPSAADPLTRHMVLWRHRALDVAAMNAAAEPLSGEHDFAAFCRRREGASTVRRLLTLRCSRPAPGIVEILVEADAFCHTMVRSLVGALIVVGEARRGQDWPREVLAGRQRVPAVTVVPAAGLTLEAVRYPPDHQLATRAAFARRVRVSTA